MNQQTGVGKAALVTGGAKRIGRAFCEALAEDGWFVHIHCHRSQDEAERLAADLRAKGGRAGVVTSDLAEPTAVQGLIGQCQGSPPLCCLINSAALFHFDEINTLTVESWRAHHDVNLLAPTLLARDFAAALPAGQDGVIVNILDNKVLAPNPDHFSYTLSKIGLEGLTRTLALALAPRIRVCGIAPGVTMISDAQTPQGFAKAQKLNPLGQGCTPEQMVGALRFILTTPAMTGQVITIDGGQHLAPPGRDVLFLTEPD